MYCSMAGEERVSKGYKYRRDPFGLKQTAITQIINSPPSGRTCSQTSSKEFFHSEDKSSKRPAMVRTIKTRPNANPACRLTQRMNRGTSHQIEGASSRREYRSKKLIKMLAKRRENICGRTPQVGIVAPAARSVANPAT